MATTYPITKRSMRVPFFNSDRYSARWISIVQHQHLAQIADALHCNVSELAAETLDWYFEMVDEWADERPWDSETREHRREPLSRRLRQAVWDKSDGRCWYCGVQTKPFDDWRPDHVVPVSKGGTNHIDNLVSACHRCNSLKSNMSVDSFRRYFRDRLFWFELAGCASESVHS